jgi:hypothetical protein
MSNKVYIRERAESENFFFQKATLLRRVKNFSFLSHYSTLIFYIKLNLFLLFHSLITLCQPLIKIVSLKLSRFSTKASALEQTLDRERRKVIFSSLFYSMSESACDSFFPLLHQINNIFNR